MVLSDINFAEQIVAKEANALEILAKNIPASFQDAIDAIFVCKGKIIVVGIGKSGHIGRKIASTLASTGQSAFFLHPSEAKHGDLGMIGKEDIVIFISYSGESCELFPVIDFTKRLNILTISIVGNCESYIAVNTNIVILLPKIQEACPIGCAPTVSSTMTLAIGDAIAMTLLAKRGFSKEQFKLLHPGGSLGRGLRFAKDIMRKDDSIPLVAIGTDMKNAVLKMSECRVGAVGITDQQKIVGIITDGDLRRSINNDVFTKKVEEIMTKNPICITQNTLLAEILNIMENNKITLIFVIDNNNIPIGCIHIHDVLNQKVV